MTCRHFWIASILVSTSTACRDSSPPPATPAPTPKPAKAAPAPAADKPFDAVLAVSFVASDGAIDHASQWQAIHRELRARPGFRESVLLGTASENPFVFINVGVWESVAAIESTLASAELGPRLQRGAPTAWYRAVNNHGDMSASLNGANILVLPFEVGAKDAETFTKKFQQNAAFFTKMPGFEAYALLRQVGGEAQYDHVLVARWASKDELDAAVRGRGPANLLPGIAPAEGGAGLYVQVTPEG